MENTKIDIGDIIIREITFGDHCNYMIENTQTNMAVGMHYNELEKMLESICRLFMLDVRGCRLTKSIKTHGSNASYFTIEKSGERIALDIFDKPNLQPTVVLSVDAGKTEWEALFELFHSEFKKPEEIPVAPVNAPHIPSPTQYFADSCEMRKKLIVEKMLKPVLHDSKTGRVFDWDGDITSDGNFVYQGKEYPELKYWEVEYHLKNVLASVLTFSIKLKDSKFSIEFTCARKSESNNYRIRLLYDLKEIQCFYGEELLAAYEMLKFWMSPGKTTNRILYKDGVEILERISDFIMKCAIESKDSMEQKDFIEIMRNQKNILADFINAMDAVFLTCRNYCVHICTKKNSTDDTDSTDE